ncbi:MAG TPA: DUF4440 domain-containing protein [Micromonosporaceae bacterium]|nr:DUF4440 domain-containing protein [Micromonosporaceae bacterium]HCU48778.1 DUF4440 domain-containing protein [Micromonosporaceae bacterium]
MLPSDLERAIEEGHRAWDVFMRGDAGPALELFSHGEEVSLANPFGATVRGWDKVSEGVTVAATHYRDGVATDFERIAEYATPDLAYIVEVERFQSKIGGADEITPFSLRVTTVLRREEDGWRMLHRHADPITSPRPPESLLRQ